MESHIAVYMQGAAIWEADMLVGIMDAVRDQTDWRVHLNRTPDLPGVGRPRFSALSGAIVGSTMPRVASALHKSEVPFVCLGYTPRPGGDSLMLDNEASGRAAARHLHALGYPGLVFMPNGTSRFCPMRAEGFLQESKQLGVRAETFQDGPRQRKAKIWSLDRQIRDFAELLMRLPKPVGVYANDESHGQRVEEAAVLAGLSIPGEVGICCHSNADLFCEYCDPSLSSVTFDLKQAGRRAVELLAERLAAPGRARRVERFAPSPLTPRASTDLLSIREPEVSRFLERLRTMMAEQPDLDSLARKAGMSRSTMERRVRRVTGKTPGECLRGFRIREATRLLRETDPDLAAIAAEVGYADKTVLSHAVKRATGSVPGTFRRKHPATTEYHRDD